MSQEEIVIYGQDGIKLGAVIWSVPEPSAVICIVHGLGEHKERYEGLANYLNENGIAVVAMDLRGHGGNRGVRGHIKSINNTLDDIEELLKTARADYTEVPMVLFGHSMGGNLVLNYCMSRNTNELRALIVSSPWLKLYNPASKAQEKLAKIASKLAPKFTQSNGLDSSLLSKDKDEVQKYIDDSLVHDSISARTYLEITQSADFITSNPKKLVLQSLIYHGDKDQIIDPKTTELFASENDATFVSIKNAYHEPHNDLEKKEVYSLILDYVQKVTS